MRVMIFPCNSSFDYNPKIVMKNFYVYFVILQQMGIFFFFLSEAFYQVSYPTKYKLPHTYIGTHNNLCDIQKLLIYWGSINL